LDKVVFIERVVGMDAWKLATELVKRLRGTLAFAALMILIGILLWETIPEMYRPLPFLLGLTALLIFAVIEVVRLRQKGAGADSVKVDAGDGSAVAAHTRGLLIQIVKNYAREHADAHEEDLQNQLSEYLDWVCDSFGVIVLRGIEQGGRQAISLSLDMVYVPLQAECQQDISDELEKYGDPGEEQRKEQPVRKNIPLNEVLSLGPHLIITGGPGCGKTTVLQHIAWSLADAIQKNSITAKEKLGLIAPLPLPVYVPLSQYASYLRKLPESASGKQRSLAAFIVDYLLRRQTNLSLREDFLAYLLRTERSVLLLLDGLDEVPNEAERVLVRQAIEDISAGKEALRVVVTSRTAAYRGQAVLGRDFRQVSVLPLEQSQIESLVQHAYGSVYPNSRAKAQAAAVDLIQQIRLLEDERRQRLGENTQPLVVTPLMVRLLLIVHFNAQKLPDQRADLYQRAVDVMLKPDYNPDAHVMDDIERRMAGSLAMNREMLQHLAFHMHHRGDDPGKDVDEQYLRAILGAEPTYAPFVDKLIDQTCERGTLLEERGGMYRFIHLSFQEFLVARYLAQNYPDANTLVTFLEAGPISASWWREPILLLFGYLDSDRPIQARRLLLRLADLDDEAADRMVENPMDSHLLAVELAVAAYLECKNQAPDLGEMLQKRIIELYQETTTTPFTPLFLANVLDGLDYMGWLPPDLGTFIPIGSPPAFWMGKYPVTNVQYQRFLDAPDFADKQYWRGFPKYGEPKAYAEMGDWGEEGWQWLQGALNDKDMSPDGKKVLPRYWNDPQFGIARRGVPVVRITWYEANAYCKWLQAHWAELEEAQLNPFSALREARLPLEREWEQAAGGSRPEGRYAWDAAGQATQDEQEILRRANVRQSGIGRSTPVGMYLLGASPSGILDLSGNVWEWQGNYSSDSRRYLALRGGSWDDTLYSARVSVRYNLNPNLDWNLSGFRVVVFPS
jgi:formylglycine-generating enzyme required for sulfatase activity